jgi:hypothetical protein
MGTTLSHHFNQFGRKHSILGIADRHHMRCIVQPTAPGRAPATGASDNQAQSLQVLNSVLNLTTKTLALYALPRNRTPFFGVNSHIWLPPRAEMMDARLGLTKPSAHPDNC